MMAERVKPILIDALTTPSVMCKLSATEWDLLIRQAKAANLLAHLAVLLSEASLNEGIPEAPFRHLTAARMITERNRAAVRWEISQLREALYDLATPIVVLKGAAYVMANLPLSQGRFFHDIDILVPRAALSEVEDKLLAWGWRTSHASHYDQHYYRTWMHEIPPLRHINRGTILDIHHSILPLTARLKPDPQKLIAESVNDGKSDDVYWLQPVDMILHSATHLFHDGELENGLRDLVDLDNLIRHFSKTDGFWERLLSRAKEMDLVRPLYYAVKYLELVLSVNTPSEVVEQLKPYGPKLGEKLMDSTFYRALLPAHASCNLTGTAAARWLLYVRSHYLRMPLSLLLPHLIRKAVTKKNAELPKEVQRFVDNNRKF